MPDCSKAGDVPVVAIVGRPNVGKSSLLNRLSGRRLAIVHDVPGTTRDRVSVRLEHKDRTFDVVDTGGMGIEDVDQLTSQIEGQIEQALADASVIVFVTDVRDGVMPLDEHAIRRLRKTDTPVILVANKCDSHVQETYVSIFYRLGLGEPLAVSAREGFGTHDLLDRIVEELPRREKPGTKPGGEPALKLTVVGRRNVGKSTLINHLCGTERVIVSDIPGTTRDAVDAPFTYEGLPYVAIDTAGIRKKRKVQGSFEYYSQDRARRAVSRADVVILMLDATCKVGKIDKELARYVVNRHKPVVIAVNKWDLADEDVSTEDFGDYIDKVLRGLAFAPIAFISAHTGEHVAEMMKVVRSLFAQASVRISTSRINRAVQDACQIQPPPSKRNRRGRIYYATQVEITPPTIVAFVNDPILFPPSYLHYLANSMRARLPYMEVPVRIDLRSHTRPR